MASFGACAPLPGADGLLPEAGPVPLGHDPPSGARYPVAINGRGDLGSVVQP
jgi:hypothetical protein